MGYYSNFRINLKELDNLKNEAKVMGRQLEIVKTIPATYSNGHIAEIAFMGMMGVLQVEMNKQEIYFSVINSMHLDKNDIDVMINKMPIQIKSCYGCNPMYEFCHLFTAWVSYDNNIFTLDTIKDILNKLNIDTDILSSRLIDKMLHVYKSYMYYYGVID